MFVGREKELLSRALKQPNEFFCCNLKWPMCRFDFIRPNCVVEEFVFKKENMSKTEIF